MTNAELRRFTRWLGKRSYQVRLERLGIERIRQIARENGKLGGRPKGSGKERHRTQPGRGTHGSLKTRRRMMVPLQVDDETGRR